MSSSEDLYSVLGAAPEDDSRALRAAYRRRARQTHPDQGGSAEEFHRVQEAWSVLGDAQARADYDRRHHRGSDSAQTPEDDGGSGVYAQGSFNNAASQRAAGRDDAAARTRQRSREADQPPRYTPDLSTPEPLSLRLTSQKVHGQPAAKGFFSSGRAQRLAQRSIELLTSHVLDQLPAARLFNDVHLSAPIRDRKGRLGLPKSGARADHVLVCGHQLIVISAAEVPAAAAAWDGHSLRSAGRTLPLPDLSAQARALRLVVEPALLETGAPELQVSGQVMLLSPDSLLSPVVEARGSGRRGAQPLAAGRALSRMAETMAADPTANLVDRHLMAALRTQLHTPEDV